MSNENDKPQFADTKDKTAWFEGASEQISDPLIEKSWQARCNELETELAYVLERYWGKSTKVINLLAELSSLNSELAARERLCEQRKRVLDAQDIELERVRIKCNENDELIDGLLRRIKILDSQSEPCFQSAKQEEIDRLKFELSELRTAYAETVVDRDEARNGWARDSQEKDTRISLLEHDLKRYDDLVEKKDTEIEALKNKQSIDAASAPLLRKMLAESKAEVGNLKIDLIHKDNLIHQKSTEIERLNSEAVRIELHHEKEIDIVIDSARRLYGFKP